MPIETRRRPGEVTTTACPFCRAPLGPQQSLANHLPKCDETP